MPFPRFQYLRDLRSRQAKPLFDFSCQLPYDKQTVLRTFHFLQVPRQKIGILRMHNGTLLIHTTSIGRKFCFSTTIFQEPFVTSISSLTKVGGSAERHSTSRIISSLRIQFCVQISIVIPFPIRWIRTCFRTSLPSTIAHQIGEE